MQIRSRTIHILAAALIIALCTSPGRMPAGEAAPQAGLPAPSLWVTPLVLDFGPVGIGDTGSLQAVTVINVGNATMTDFLGGWVDPPFYMWDNCSPNLAPGGVCYYSYLFSPTESGLFSATSSVSTSAGSFSIELHGAGVGAGLSASPLSLDFGSVYIFGNPAPSQEVTIHNTGLSPLTFLTASIPSPFTLTGDNCGITLLAGESCQYSFGFSPPETGIFTTTALIDTDVDWIWIDLMGQGRSTLYAFGQRVTPRSLDFGPVGVGLSSPTQVVTITNQSLFDTITGWAGGGVLPPFSAAQNCAGGVPPGGSCQFYYTFQPSETGIFTATSYVTNSYGSFSIELRGGGAGAGLSATPLSLGFGSMTPGSQSTPQQVRVKNTGLSTLNDFTGGGVPSPFHISQVCAGGVPSGGECTYGYYFEPNDWGRYSASVDISTNAGSFTIQLTGGAKRPSMQMHFDPDPISLGETATLYYTIHNPNTGFTLFDVQFDNAFPSGMSVASPLVYSVSPQCGAPTFAPASGATSLAFYDATLLGGDDCVISLDVTAPDIGVYRNSAGPVKSASGWGNTASATLAVGSIVYMPLIVR